MLGICAIRYAIAAEHYYYANKDKGGFTDHIVKNFRYRKMD